MAPSSPRSTQLQAPPRSRPARRNERRSCGPSPGIRKSKAGPRRAAVLVLVHALIAVHVAHWVTNGSTLSPLEPSEAMHFTKDGIVNAGLVFFGAAILSTAVFGRWFCGWGCHLVALQDLCRWMLGKLGIKPRPLRSRLLLLVPGAAFFYMFLYPLAYRAWHGLGFGYRGTELTTDSFWATFPPWPIALATFLFSGFLIIYFLGAKGFCTYACPYGAIFGVVDRLAPGRIRVTDACEGCGHCTAVCSSNVKVHEEVRTYGAVVDPACMKCLDCVSVCPNDALYFGFGKPELFTRPRRASAARVVAGRLSRWKLWRWKQLAWWEELVLASAFLVAFFTFRGLYGLVPFLFSLAIAAVAAFLALQTARLFRRRNVSVQQLAIKADGRLTRWGFGFVAAMLLASAFWAHSAMIQYQVHRLNQSWQATEDSRRAWFDERQVELTQEESARADDALGRARFLERFALLDDPRNNVRIANLELLFGREEEFERRMRDALARAPEDPSLHADLAQYFAALGSPEPAFASFARAIELAPSDLGLQSRMALYAQRLGALERAAAILDTALRAHPEHPGILFSLGLVHAERGDAAAAVSSFRRAVAADPDAIPARENLALGLKVLGLHREAIRELEELLTRDPDLADARFQVADSAARLGDYSLAETHLRELERREGERPAAAQAWALVGQIAAGNGDARAAAVFFARASELDPTASRQE